MRLSTILVAEDDEEDRFLIREAFERNHLANQLVFVNDGVALLQYLRNSGAYGNRLKYPKPGIILLDLNMPKKDGKEVLDNLRAEPELSIIPVIVLTTSREEEDMLCAYQKGASSFISKPEDFDDLVAVMGTLKTYWFGVVELPASRR